MNSLMPHARLLLLVAGAVATAAPTPARAATVIEPIPSTETIVNPGKGWVLYTPAPSSFPDLLPLAGLGYGRFAWAEIEPARGQYRWETIDRALAAWAAVGRQYAFGVMCASTHSRADRPFVTPEWVFQDGAKRVEIDLVPKESTSGTSGHKIAPVFDDPIFLAHLKGFIAALGQRYDGHPALAFYDIRSYGNWGEGHMHPFKVPDIRPQKLEEHIALHLDAFHKTRLVLPWGSKRFDPIYDRMVRRGVGLRRDGICGNSDGSETARCLGFAPAVFEFFGSYESMKQKGWWDGRPDSWGYGHTLESCVAKGAPSFIGPINQGAAPGTIMVREEGDLVRRLANRMGYHFVLVRARVPSALDRAAPADVELVWENRGVSPITIPADIAFALLAPADERVVATCPARASRPADWMPGKRIVSGERLSFPDASPGDYRLAIGALRPGEGAPSIRLAIDTPRVRGWHALAPITLR